MTFTTKNFEINKMTKRDEEKMLTVQIYVTTICMFIWERKNDSVFQLLNEKKRLILLLNILLISMSSLNCSGMLFCLFCLFCHFIIPLAFFVGFLECSFQQKNCRSIGFESQLRYLFDFNHFRMW
jgi:hypothetical protein